MPRDLSDASTRWHRTVTVALVFASLCAAAHAQEFFREADWSPEMEQAPIRLVTRLPIVNETGPPANQTSLRQSQPSFSTQTVPRLLDQVPLPSSIFQAPSIRLSSAELGTYGASTIHTMGGDDPSGYHDRQQIGDHRNEHVVFDHQPPLPGKSLPDDPNDPSRSVRREIQILKQQLEELEVGRTAHEDATRAVIRKTFAEKGSHINDMVIFGGGIETTVGWFGDFGELVDADGFAESDIFLSTAEMDFEIQVSPWVTGFLVLEYIAEFNELFRVTQTFSPVDRITIDVAYFTIGDTQRCWPYITMGRVIAPFGISTGTRLGDVLTVEGPLTTDIFEYREDVVMFGFEAPTPPPPPPPSTASIQPPPQGTIWPIVRPRLIRPVINNFAHRHCRGVYCGAVPPPAVPTPTLPPPCLPPFTGAVYFYNGKTFRGTRTPIVPPPLGNQIPFEFVEGENHIEHVGATLGYRTQGCCGPLGWPWTIDFDIDFNSSAFDSNFLQFEYRPFLGDIGYVPAMATHIKSSLGPFSFIAEWNSALKDARFQAYAWESDAFTNVQREDFSIRPAAWAVALGYQCDWNPGVQEIGAQGTYFAITYSESRDMAGVLNASFMDDGSIDQVDRVGSVPHKRLSVGIGEWVFDGLRVAFEYSHVIDYQRSIRTGATGRSANAYFATVSYEW